MDVTRERLGQDGGITPSEPRCIAWEVRLRLHWHIKRYGNVTEGRALVGHPQGAAPSHVHTAMQADRSRHSHWVETLCRVCCACECRTTPCTCGAYSTSNHPPGPWTARCW